MRLYLLILIVMLSLSFVSAELTISCESDDSCDLFLDGSWCEEDLCVIQESEDNLEIRDEFKDYKDVEWSVLVLEEKEEVVCENCLNFAPEFTGNLFVDLFNWLFYAK